MRAKKRVRTDQDKLKKARRALAQICELASDPEKGYPERIGGIKYQAALTLHQLGESTWWEKINEQLKLNLPGGP